MTVCARAARLGDAAERDGDVAVVDTQVWQALVGAGLHEREDFRHLAVRHDEEVARHLVTAPLRT